MDYAACLAPELRAFIAESEALMPADLPLNDWQALRAAYNRMAAAFHVGRPEGLAIADTRVAGVPVRIYGAPTGVRILYAHGGGFVLGGLESHDDICAELALRCRCQVVSVDYRLSPEHLHPAAYDDLAAVAEALAAEGPLVLAGDSAGATLCAALAGTRADLPLRGQVLIYPMLGYPAEGGSFERHAHAPLLSRDDLAFYGAIRQGAADDPRLIPARGDLAGLPTSHLFAAECDPLCDDALQYAAAASARGSDVRAVVQKGVVHGWLRARHRSPALRALFSDIVEALRDLAH